MAEETKVRVRIDTRSAKAQLEGLMKTARKAPGRIAARIRGEALRGIGLGAGIGIGMSAIRGPTAQGFGDVIGEAFGGWGEALKRWALGNMASEAEGMKQARSEMQQAYGVLAGAQDWKSLPTGVRAQWEALKARRVEEARGREVIRRQTYDDQFLEKLIERLGKAFADAATAAVNNMKDLLSQMLPW
jgi:hypothetical protein